MSGKHIELFLVDGEPGGITTANISGWTGHILSGPRTALTRLLDREEAHRNGVYLLLGDDPDASRASPAISGKPRTSPLDSVSTTDKRTGGTGPSSSAAVTTPSTKDTGATSRPGLLKSPTSPSAARYQTTPRHRSPGNSRRPSSPMLRCFSSRFVASSRSSESTFFVALTGALNGKHLHLISTLRFSHSLPLSTELKPGLALSGASSSCWKDPASSANGPTRGARQVPADPMNPSALNTPNSSMTEVSLSRERSALSHGISPSPRHPPPALLPSATPAMAVSPGPGRAAPTRTGRTGPDRWFHHPRRFSPTLTKASSHDHS